MKIKFTKTLAIACILSLAFATLTAFAAPAVTTITSYDYEAADNALMTIDTTVSGLDADGEITYYVADASGNIVYVDQATSAGKAAAFKFQAAQGEVLAATAVYGSNLGCAFPTFEFNEGCNYLTEGTPTITETPGAWGEKTAEGYIFQGKVSGAVTAYGVAITINGTEYELQAMGCDDDGTFAIEIQNISEAELATAEQFVR